MQRILITGGFGKIAKYFVQNFDHKYQITVADIVTNRETYSSKVQIEKADLMDSASCAKLCEGIETVVHLAGIVDPISNSDDILETNIKMTQNVFKAAVMANCKKLIFASSAQTIEGYPTDVQVQTGMLVQPKTSTVFPNVLEKLWLHIMLIPVTYRPSVCGLGPMSFRVI